jgi:hypothetical protein
MSVYSTEPVKKNTGGGKGITPTPTTPVATGQKEVKVSFSTISDSFYEKRNKLFDADKNKFKTSKDFHAQIVGGAAGVVYNTLLLVSVEGKGAQAALNAGRIATSTTSLTLGSDMNVLSALGVSTVGTLVKPSFASYDFVKPGLKNVAKTLEKEGVENIVSRMSADAVTAWSRLGNAVHNKYNELPGLRLGAATFSHGHTHYPFALAYIPLPWVEAGIGKIIGKSVVPGGKKNYEPYYTGQPALNQLYLANNLYNSTTPTTSLFDSVKSRDLGVSPTGQTGKSTIQITITTITTYEPNQSNIKIYNPERDAKEKKDRLEGFVAEFEAKKSKDKWIERLDRIFRPQLYTSYDKAKSELYDIKEGRKPSLSIALIKFLLEDIIKSIKNISKGYEGVQKLANGIDYNDTVINQLAAYKSDLEAAGGKFIIESNGNFRIVRPPEGAEPQYLQGRPLPGTNIILKQPEDGPDSGSRGSEIRKNNARNFAIKGNVPTIRGLVASANKTAWKEAYNKFRIENKELVKGKWHADVLPLFYTAYPKFAPQMTSRQIKNQMLSDYYSNPSSVY